MANLMSVPLVPDDYSAWDRFVSRSQDAWFWHTSEWMRYTKEYAASSLHRNTSFWIVDGQARLAAVPAMLETGPAGERLSCAGGPLPAPAVDPALGPEKKQQVLFFALEQLWRRAEESKVDSFQMAVPALAPAVISASPPVANPLLRLGCLDLPYQTQVVDLRQDLKELWSQVRHGHHYDIRRGEKMLEARVWSGESLGEEKFREYQELHAKDAGRVTRSQATFDMMKAWVRSGHGILVEASIERRPVAFALVIIFGRGAYYGSSAKDPDRPELPGSHIIQWRTIQWLKENGVCFYNLGFQQFGAQWFDRPGPKELGISKFKRGFGGVAVPQYTGEFHRTEAGLCRAIETRLEQFLPRAALPKPITK